MKFRLQIDRERCKGCALCVSACVQTALRLSKGLNAKGQHFAEFDPSQGCTGCRRCADLCPEAAIKIVREKNSDAAPPGGDADDPDPQRAEGS